jgi:hypothetical protein
MRGALRCATQVVLAGVAACTPATPYSYLAPTALGPTSDKVSLEVELENTLSDAYVLRNALIVVDGQLVFGQVDDPNGPGGRPPLPPSSARAAPLAGRRDVATYRASIPPGTHTAQLRLAYEGNGDAVQSLAGYWFDVRASHPFNLVDGDTLRITVVAYEKGGPTTPFDRRPAVRWSENPDRRADGGAADGAGT